MPVQGFLTGLPVHRQLYISCTAYVKPLICIRLVVMFIHRLCGNGLLSFSILGHLSFVEATLPTQMAGNKAAIGSRPFTPQLETSY